MFGLKNKTLLWKNAGQIIALLIIATQIICVELSVTDNIEKIRGKRNKFTRPTTYQVSNVEIQYLENFIQNITNVITNASKAEPVNNSITCNTTLCSIKNKVEQLLDLTNKYIKNNSNKSDTYTVLNEKHKKELEDVKKSLNDEIRHYIEDRDNQTEEKIKIQIELGVCLKKYEKQSEELLNTRISLCAAQISLGKFERASEVLSLFNYHDEMLAHVMEYTYNNEPNDIDKILQFLFKDSKCDEKTYTTLFENMKKNNQLHDLIVLRFYLEIDTCYLENLKKKVLPYCDWVIKAWVPKIHMGDDNKILDFANKSSRNSHSITLHISDIVDNVYSDDLRNYKNTIKFLNKLSISTRIHGYSALLHQMTINNHLHNEEIFEFAFLVKKMEESYQLHDDSIRSKIPVVIRKIVWQENCRIKNIGESEYLYAPHDGYIVQNIRNQQQWGRRIFTWIPGNPINNGNWKFEPSLCSTCFFIKSTFWNNYNYLTVDLFFIVDFFEPLMLIAKPFKWQENFIWKLEPRTISNRNVFILKNLNFENMRLTVYSRKHDSDRRNSGLVIYDSSSDFHWQIE